MNEEPKLNYSHARPADLCHAFGLGYDRKAAEEADRRFAEASFTQAQFDAAMTLHVQRVAFLFSPRNYSFVQRLRIAVWFVKGGTLAPAKEV